MEPLFSNPLLQQFAERALQTVNRGGAEYGECEAVARRVTASNDSASADRSGSASTSGDGGSGGPGDGASGTVGSSDGGFGGWYRAWTDMAQQVAGWGEQSAKRGHEVSARQAFLRATTYYCVAYYPLYGAPVDPRLTEAAGLEHECFHRYAELADHPVVPISVPFEGTTLPGYLCLPAGATERDEPRPTLIAVNGYDSNVHEMYWSHAAPAISRGYAALLVDGPGQGQPLVEQGLYFRPDWETVLRPIVDHALTLPTVDGDRLAVMGWSFGGYLASRGVSGDTRIAALVADPGQWDQLDPVRGRLPLPDELKEQLPDVDPAELDPYLAPLAEDPALHWKFVQRGQWVHGVDSLGAYVVELGRYRLSDVVDQISCPTLVASAEGDPVAAYADQLYAALPRPGLRVHFTASEGAASHCEAFNRSRFDQRIFDWLDETLSV